MNFMDLNANILTSLLRCPRNSNLELKFKLKTTHDPKEPNDVNMLEKLQGNMHTMIISSVEM